MESPPSDARAAAGPPELTRQQKVFTIVGALLGMLLAALDQTIVSTAGPAIARDLRMPPSMYAWITTAYMLTSTVLVPIYGKLSDRFGRRPVLLVGMGLFLLGSMLCGLARSPPALIVSRGCRGWDRPRCSPARFRWWRTSSPRRCAAGTPGCSGRCGGCPA
jgi:predicted MFS family arabinose efflux permease